MSIQQGSVHLWCLCRYFQSVVRACFLIMAIPIFYCPYLSQICETFLLLFHRTGFISHSLTLCLHTVKSCIFGCLIKLHWTWTLFSFSPFFSTCFLLDFSISKDLTSRFLSILLNISFLIGLVFLQHLSVSLPNFSSLSYTDFLISFYCISVFANIPLNSFAGISSISTF